MFFFAAVAAIVIIAVVFALVVFLGGIGAFRRGPHPSEGDKSTG